MCPASCAVFCILYFFVNVLFVSVFFFTCCKLVGLRTCLPLGSGKFRVLCNLINTLVSGTRYLVDISVQNSRYRYS